MLLHDFISDGYIFFSAVIDGLKAFKMIRKYTSHILFLSLFFLTENQPKKIGAKKRNS